MMTLFITFLVLVFAIGVVSLISTAVYMKHWKEDQEAKKRYKENGELNERRHS